MNRKSQIPTLLAGLSPGARGVLVKLASRVKYPAGVSLVNESGQPDCVFVERGLVSLHMLVGSHLSGAVGLVGPGGMVGVPSLLGFGARLPLAIAVTAVEGYAIPVGQLRTSVMQLPDLREAVSSYVSVRFTQALVSSACNLEHGLGARLADWIVLASRLLGEASVAVTHERLASILGATRPSVTLALQSLEEEKAIRSRRGNIDVIDSRRLAMLACGCGALDMSPPPGPA